MTDDGPQTEVLEFGVDDTLVEDQYAGLRMVFAEFGRRFNRDCVLPLQAVFRHMGEVWTHVLTQTLTQTRHTHAHLLRVRRTVHGGNSTDAIKYPSEYMTTVCGAWLCQAGETCPSDAYQLECTHTCHQGDKT